MPESRPLWSADQRPYKAYEPLVLSTYIYLLIHVVDGRNDKHDHDVHSSPAQRLLGVYAAHVEFDSRRKRQSKSLLNVCRELLSRDAVGDDHPAVESVTTVDDL